MMYVVVTTLPALFFFSTYAVLIGLWVEVSVRARGRNHVLTNRLMHVAHAGIYVLQLFMYCAVWAVSLPIAPAWLPSPFRVWELNDVFFGLYSLAMLGTILVYGTRIWRQFKDVPLESASKKSMMMQVTFTTVVCSVCFLARALCASPLPFGLLSPLLTHRPQTRCFSSCPSAPRRGPSRRTRRW